MNNLLYMDALNVSRVASNDWYIQRVHMKPSEFLRGSGREEGTESFFNFSRQRKVNDTGTWILRYYLRSCKVHCYYKDQSKNDN